MEHLAAADHRYRILLVEDSAEDLELYKRLLKNRSGLNLEVYEAKNVRNAIDLCQNEHFDCFVVDYRLPDADGIEFIKHVVAQNRENMDAGIVMVTGHGSEEIAVEALKLGVHEYLTKKSISEGHFLRPVLNSIYRAKLINQVAHYQKELERSNKDLADFTHTASHDLKSPLRRIFAYCEILQEDAASRLNDEDKGILERIMANARRMQTLIDDLLSYSLIQSEQEERETVDLQQLVREIVDEFEPQIQEADATIEIVDLPKLYIFRMRIRQLFCNLISNALKYRAERPLRIVIEAQPSSGNLVTLSVQDNGQGIPAEFQNDIFMDFKRLHAHEDIEGTGLGLPICKKIVERHGGKIWVVSQRGEGSTFLFTLKNTQPG